MKVQLWRCSVCGKWSHAKRKPAWHERFIPNPPEPVRLPGTLRTASTAYEIASDAELEVIQEQSPSWNGDPEREGDPGGVRVRCGPFEDWEARPVTEDSRPLAVHTLGRMGLTV